MPTTITFTFQDLLLFILWGLVVAVFVLLIRILLRALKIMKEIQLTVSENREHIDRTIELVPKISNHVEAISSEVAHDIAAFRPTIDNVAQTTENVSAKLEENSGLVGGIGAIMHTVSIGKALFDRYFGKKMETSIGDIKDAILDVEHAIREIEKEKNQI